MIRLFAATTIVLSLAIARGTQGQPTQPAPSTSPVERKALTVPPGFRLIAEGDRRVLCQEGDEAWVRQALADKTPTTRPTTMPSDLAERLRASRKELIERLTADLALTDNAAAAKFVDDQLIPLLADAAKYRPPVYYLVTTRDTLREIVKNGWSDPTNRYHYNRAADQVAIPTQLQLSMEGESDDQVLAVLHTPEQDLTARRELLTRLMLDTESQLNYFLSARALFLTQMELLEFIGRSTIEPLSLGRDDQQWFGVGVSGVLSARYLALINGSAPDSFLPAMTQDDRRNPVRSATVNLLNPMNPADMRSAARPAYADAVRRKSTAVVKSWLDRAGDAALPKVIAAIRAAPPVDGAALVKLVAAQTGIDLTADLQPR
jgi:hypothetical protein